MLIALAALPLAASPVPSAPPIGRVTRLEATATPAPTPEKPGEQVDLTTGADTRLTVPVSVGGAGPFRFLVDTGADSSAVSRQLADRLSLPPGRTAKHHSVTGQTNVATASVTGMRVATRALPDVTAPVLEAQNVGADGILGTDVLRSAMVRFDFRNNLLSIVASDRASRRAEPDTIVVEARKRAGRLIITEAELDGQRLTVVLDTGSEISIGNEALRRALARRRALTDNQPIELRSVTGAMLQARFMLVRELDIGGVTMAGLGIAFADAHTFTAMGLNERPALLLGMNALQAFDSVTIDMGARKLRFAMPGRGQRMDNALLGTSRQRG